MILCINADDHGAFLLPFAFDKQSEIGQCRRDVGNMATCKLSAFLLVVIVGVQAFVFDNVHFAGNGECKCFMLLYVFSPIIV